MMKRDGLMNSVQDKLITTCFVTGVVIGRNIVRAKTAVAAWRQSRDTVWQSPITTHTANQNVVEKN